MAMLLLMLLLVSMFMPWHMGMLILMLLPATATANVNGNVDCDSPFMYMPVLMAHADATFALVVATAPNGGHVSRFAQPRLGGDRTVREGEFPERHGQKFVARNLPPKLHCKF